MRDHASRRVDRTTGSARPRARDGIALGAWLMILVGLMAPSGLTQTSIDVTTLGASPAAAPSTNATAFQAAISAAVTLIQSGTPGPIDITVPPGSYRIGSPSSSLCPALPLVPITGTMFCTPNTLDAFHLYINDGAPPNLLAPPTDLRLTFKGDPNAELVFTDRTKHGFLLSNVRNVEIRDLTLRYEDPSFSQGTITGISSSGTTLTLQADAGYPDPLTDSALTFPGGSYAQWLVAYDANTSRPRVKTGSHFLYFTGSLLSPGTTPGEYILSHNIDLSDPGTYNMEVGDRYVIVNADITDLGFGITAVGCEQLHLDQLLLHRIPSEAIFPIFCAETSITNCAVEPLPGSADIISAGKCGVFARHCINSSATQAPSIEILDSRFIRTMDDAIAIHTQPFDVTGFQPPGPGTSASITIRGENVRQTTEVYGPDIDPSTMQYDFDVYDTNPATSTQNAAYLGVVTAGGPGIFAGQDPVTLQDRYTITLASGATLPAALDAGDLLVPRFFQARHFACNNNTIQGTRGRGMLIRGIDGEIAENTIFDLNFAGIALGPELKGQAFKDAGFTENVEIRANYIRNVGSGYRQRFDEWLQLGAITAGILSHQNGNCHPVPMRHINLTISENVISNAALAGITAASVDQLTISNNLIYNVQLAPSYAAGSASGISVASVTPPGVLRFDGAIHVQDSVASSLMGNIVEFAPGSSSRLTTGRNGCLGASPLTAAPETSPGNLSATSFERLEPGAGPIEPSLGFFPSTLPPTWSTTIDNIPFSFTGMWITWDIFGSLHDILGHAQVASYQPGASLQMTVSNPISVTFFAADIGGGGGNVIVESIPVAGGTWTAHATGSASIPASGTFVTTALGLSGAHHVRLRLVAGTGPSVMLIDEVGILW